jgi:hypothetical protein
VGGPLKTSPVYEPALDIFSGRPHKAPNIDTKHIMLFKLSAGHGRNTSSVAPARLMTSSSSRSSATSGGRLHPIAHESGLCRTQPRSSRCCSSFEIRSTARRRFKLLPVCLCVLTSGKRGLPLRTQYQSQGCYPLQHLQRHNPSRPLTSASPWGDVC